MNRSFYILMILAGHGRYKYKKMQIYPLARLLAFHPNDRERERLESRRHRCLLKKFSPFFVDLHAPIDSLLPKAFSSLALPFPTND